MLRSGSPKSGMKESQKSFEGGRKESEKTSSRFERQRSATKDHKLKRNGKEREYVSGLANYREKG